MAGAELVIAAGTNNFKKLVTTSDVFIDKTLFIKEIIDSGDEAILITRPRRWGKSLALDMLKTFLSIKVDAVGNKLSENPNRALFEGGSITIKSRLGVTQEKILSQSKLAQEEGGKYLTAQGQFPVIHVSFQDVRCTDYMSAENKLKEVLQGLYSQYRYLEHSDKLDDIQKARFLKHVSGLFAESAEKKSELSSSLKFLTELLYKHHDMPVYVLVDEYDKPVQYFLENGLAENIEDRKKVAHLVEGMLGECGKGNDNLQKIILTGIFDTLKKGSTGFNNVKVFRLNHHKYANYFGFTENDVKELVALLTDDKVRQYQAAIRIQDWYNGYNIQLFGGELIKVYNPFAVMNYLSDSYDSAKGFIPGIPVSYWVESGMDDILAHLSQYSLSIDLLNKLKSLAEHRETTLNFPQSFHLFHATETRDTVIRYMEGIIAYILFNGGYISISGDSYVIPNKEVLEYFQEKVLEAWLAQTLDLSSTDCIGIADALGKNIPNPEEFKKKVQELILNKIDNSDRTESDFQSWVGGAIMFHSLQSRKIATHEVLSEKHAKFGRIDNIFYPIIRVDDTSRAGSTSEDLCSGPIREVIIHEYKKLDKTAESELRVTLESALWQILEKGYLSEPLSKKDAHAHHTWIRIRLRSVVFIRDETPGGKWTIHVSEKELNVAQAEILNSFFSQEPVREILGLNNRSRKPEVTRHTFLDKLKTIAGKPLMSITELMDVIITDSASILAALSVDAATVAALATTSGGVCKASSGAHVADHLESTSILESRVEASAKRARPVGRRSRGRTSNRDGSRMLAVTNPIDGVVVGNKRDRPDTGIDPSAVEDKRQRTVPDARAMMVDSARDRAIESNTCQDCGGVLPGKAGGAVSRVCGCKPEDSVVGFCFIYSDNQLFNYNRITDVLSRAKAIGGRELLNLLMDIASNAAIGKQLVQKFEQLGIDQTLYMLMYHAAAIRTHAIFASASVAESFADRAPVLYHDKAEPTITVLQLDPIKGAFNAFINLVNEGGKAAGELLLEAQRLLNAVLDSPESTKQTILTTILLDIVDALTLNTDAPLPFFPGFGGDPDDEPGYGGGGSGGQPDGGGNGFGVIFSASSENDFFNTTNISASGSVGDMQGDIRY